MHYLDNASTTQVLPECISLVQALLKDCFANPSSLYSLGVKAENELNHNREIMANLLGCIPTEIIFTSGGTESNNIAILGAARARSNWGKNIVTTGYEHPAVLKPMSLLENDGFEVIYINPSNKGIICEDELLSNINKDTALVSMIHINNETGSFIDVVHLAEKIKEINPRTVVHVDGAQSFGKISMEPLVDTQIDLFSISGHKIHAPKGVGALYIKKGLYILPPEQGGNQEFGIRSGTENIPYIAALSLAAEISFKNIQEFQSKIAYLANQLLTGLHNINGIDIHINSPDIRYEGILNFSLLGLKSETVLHFLEEKDIYISTGSACSKGKPSHTLLSMGIEHKYIDSALRVSIDGYNDETDILALLDGLQAAAKTIVRVIHK